jgi:hypothetical protein
MLSGIFLQSGFINRAHSKFSGISGEIITLKLVVSLLKKDCTPSNEVSAFKEPFKLQNHIIGFFLALLGAVISWEFLLS